MRYSKYKKLLFPLGATGVIIVVGVVIANFFVGKITQILAETAVQRSKNTVLDGRVTTLQTLSDDIKSSVNSATLAIPDKNPSIYVVSQLRGQAEENGVILRNLSIGSPTIDSATSLSNYGVSFEAQAANYDSFFNFIGSLSNITPLVNLSTLEISKGLGSEVMATVELVAYSSAFPNELPALEEPLVGLTPAEQSVLDLIESFSPPTTVSAPGVEQPLTPRSNPFSLEI